MADSTNEMAPSWASGIGVFAGIVAIIGGAHQAIEAIAAIVNAAEVQQPKAHEVTS